MTTPLYVQSSRQDHALESSLRFFPDTEMHHKDTRLPQNPALRDTYWLMPAIWSLLTVSDGFMIGNPEPNLWLIRLFPLLMLALLPLMLHGAGHAIRNRHWWHCATLLLAACGQAIITAHHHSADNQVYFYLQWLLFIMASGLSLTIPFQLSTITSVISCLLYGIASGHFRQMREQADFAATYPVLMMLALILVILGTKRCQELRLRISHARATLESIKRQQLEETNKQLLCQVARDTLTGAYNRRALDKAYSRLWRHAARTQRPISILFIDVDYFKQYNDTYGHAAGDRCLIGLAELLQDIAKRPLDFVARFGGEEFVIILPDTRPVQAGIYAEKIRARIAATQLPHLGSPEGKLTVSIGSAGGIPHSTDQQNLYLDQADQALYLAKKQGRNRVAHYPQQIQTQAI